MILMILLIIKIVTALDDCKIKGIPNTAKSLYKTAEASRGSLSLIGVKVINNYSPDLIESNDDFIAYFLGCASFGIPFIVFFVLFITYYLFSLICSFCFCCPFSYCCTPSKSQRPNTILAIIHIIGSLLFFASSIVFLIGCINITDGIIEVSNLPNTVETEMDGIFINVYNIFGDTFNLISNMLNNIEYTLHSLSAWISQSGTQNIKNAEESVLLIESYQNTFTNSSKPYKTVKTQLDNLVQSSELNNDYSQKLNAMDASITPAITTIEDLAKILINVSNDLEITSNNIDSTVKSSIKDIQRVVTNYQNGALVSHFDNLYLSIHNLTNSLQPIRNFSSYITDFVNPIIIIATIFIILIAFLYAIIFFFRNKISRCFLCLFPIFGILICILIILPAVVFSIFYLAIYDICPDLENSLQKFIGDSEFGNLSDVLICQQEKPLFQMLSLNFNSSNIIDDLAAFATQSLHAFEIPQKLTDEMTNYSSNFFINNDISSNHIILDHSTTLSSLIDAASSSNVNNKEQIIQQAQEAQEIIASQEGTLSQVKALMTDVTDFGSRLIPRLQSTQRDNINIVKDFTREARISISKNVDNITCRSIKCVYSPVRNALCYNFLSGISLWIISCIIFIFALTVISITLFIRRRQMADPPKISSEDSSMSGELSSFQPIR